MPLRVSADWLLTGTGDVIEFGAVLTDSAGRILAVGADAAVPNSPLFHSEFFSQAVLIPGLVNAHTHLELTGFDGRAQERDFSQWIRSVIQLKAGRDPAAVLAASREGLLQSFASGVTTVADTGDSGAPLEALAELKGSGIAYLEVFGPHPADAEKNLAAFAARLEHLSQFQSERVRIGVSPHAPYSVSAPLYAGVAKYAAERGLPVAVHVAESEAESQLLETGEGPFADLWRSRDIPLPGLPGRTPLAWLEEHGVLGPRTLCIHVVRADERDIARLARHGCGVAHCPRSNRRHGHGDAPLAAILKAGIPLGIGTDSAASVSPPDLLAEARAAAALADLSITEALHRVMLGSAEAIGLDRVVGSLETEKWADLVAVRVPGGMRRDRVARAVLASRPTDVLATFVGGREVYRKAS